MSLFVQCFLGIDSYHLGGWRVGKGSEWCVCLVLGNLDLETRGNIRGLSLTLKLGSRRSRQLTTYRRQSNGQWSMVNGSKLKELLKGYPSSLAQLSPCHVPLWKAAPKVMSKYTRVPLFCTYELSGYIIVMGSKYSTIQYHRCEARFTAPFRFMRVHFSLHVCMS